MKKYITTYITIGICFLIASITLNVIYYMQKPRILNESLIPEPLLFSFFTLHNVQTTQSIAFNLINTNGIFTQNTKTLNLPLDNTRLQEFIQLLHKKRTVQIYSKNMVDKQLTKIIHIDFFNNSKNLVYTLDFYNPTFNEKNIVFTVNNKAPAYITENDLMSFFSTNPAFWAYPYLLPQTIQKIFSENAKTNRIQSIQFVNKTHTLQLFTGDTKFNYTIQSLITAQSSRFTNFSDIGTTAVKAQFIISIKNSEPFILNIYEKNSQLYVAHNNEYALEISQWTYQRLYNGFF